MQTKFKWTPTQRMLLIQSMAMGIMMSPSQEISNILANDIYKFSTLSAESINEDVEIQSKLKTLFSITNDLSNSMKDANLHNLLLKEENKEEKISFGA